MAPKGKIRGRGASRAGRRPAIGGAPSQFTPPSVQGVTLSWQTPMVAPARQRSGSSTRGQGPSRAASAQTSAEAGEKGKTRKHESVPDTPSSHWVTLRLPTQSLTSFPTHRKKDRWFRDESASEPFVTLKVGQRTPAVTAAQHSKQDPPPKSLTLQIASPAQAQESPLPALTSAATSVFDFGVGSGPQTPLENQPHALPEKAASLKTKFALQENLQHPGTKQAQLPRDLKTTAKRSAGLQDSASEMAPVKDTTGVQAGIKDVIQNLYEIQSQTHGYVPETADLLVDKMTDLAQSLNRLQNMTSTTASPNNPIHNVRIAPEIVDYVDDGRNPDIFTRDFVENVQRGNAVINGKQKAFKDFSEVFAQVLKQGMPELNRHVDKIMDNAGFGAEDASQVKKADVLNGPQPNGRNGS